MSSSPTTISIHPATPLDAANMVDLDLAAFADNPFVQKTFHVAAASPAQLAEFRTWRTSILEHRMTGPGKRYYKAVDEETGDMVGYAGFYAPEGFDLESNWTSAVAMPAFIDVAGQREFREKSKAAKERWVGGRKDVWCEYFSDLTCCLSYWVVCLELCY